MRGPSWRPELAGIVQVGLAVGFPHKLKEIVTPCDEISSYPPHDLFDFGDDLFDAHMASHWALVTQGAAPVPSIITINHKTRDQLLGAPSSLDLLRNLT